MRDAATLAKALRDYAKTLDATERPAEGEYDEAELFRAAADMLEVLLAATDPFDALTQKGRP